MDVERSGSQPCGILLRRASIFAESYDVTRRPGKKGRP